jgi:hypothetical protein
MGVPGGEDKINWISFLAISTPLADPTIITLRGPSFDTPSFVPGHVTLQPDLSWMSLIV